MLCQYRTVTQLNDLPGDDRYHRECSVPSVKRVAFFLVLFACHTDSACSQERRHASTCKNLECSLRTVTTHANQSHSSLVQSWRLESSAVYVFTLVVSAKVTVVTRVHRLFSLRKPFRHSLTSKKPNGGVGNTKRLLLTASCLGASLIKQPSVDLSVRTKQHLDTKNVLKWTQSGNRRLQHFLVSLLQLLAGSETSFLPHRQRKK